MTDKPIYAVGDIHGQFDMLQDAMARIERDGGPDARVVFLGDYTDRGPDSRAVISYLEQGLRDGRDWICLLGNHDRMFSMFVEDYPRNDARLLVGYHWLHPRIGGIETLQSYGVGVPDGARTYQIHALARAAVPQSHRAFLAGLKPYYQVDDLLFVHAGLRPQVPLAAQSEDDLIWIREEFLEYQDPHPWMVVHGHSHVVRAEHRGNRINLDSGAGYGHTLTCAVFENGQAWVLAANGRADFAR